MNLAILAFALIIVAGFAAIVTLVIHGFGWWALFIVFLMSGLSVRANTGKKKDKGGDDL
jgi:hypothetical protein